MPTAGSYLSPQELAIYQSRLKDNNWAMDVIRKMSANTPLPGRIAQGLRPL